MRRRCSSSITTWKPRARRAPRASTAASGRAGRRLPAELAHALLELGHDGRRCVVVTRPRERSVDEREVSCLGAADPGGAVADGAGEQPEAVEVVALQVDTGLGEEAEGVRLLVDPMSFQYLIGAEIDYQENIKGAQFVIKNPGASSTCGGSSPNRTVFWP